MWLAAMLAGVAALVIVIAAAGQGTRAAASATLTCDTTDATYGDTIDCTVESDDEVAIDWGDGTFEVVEGAASNAPAAVGEVTISVVDDAGAVLASHGVTIVPDLSVECEQGLPLPVYELAPSIGAPQPYDYVYVAADGSKIVPGDADYPSNLGEMLAAERSVVEQAPIVGLCRSVSAAADDLGGSVVWTVESPWYEPYTTKSRNITPGTPAHWDGVQPIDVSIVVDVDGHEASERIGVYFGGCG